MSTDVAHLGFCLIPKSSISDQWSSHRIKERGNFEIKWKNLSVFGKTEHENCYFTSDKIKMA